MLLSLYPGWLGLDHPGTFFGHLRAKNPLQRVIYPPNLSETSLSLLNPFRQRLEPPWAQHPALGCLIFHKTFMDVLEGRPRVGPHLSQKHIYNSEIMMIFLFSFPSLPGSC